MSQGLYLLILNSFYSLLQADKRHLVKHTSLRLTLNLCQVVLIWEERLTLELESHTFNSLNLTLQSLKQAFESSELLREINNPLRVSLVSGLSDITNRNYFFKLLKFCLDNV
jgi:hypothetical protein